MSLGLELVLHVGVQLKDCEDTATDDVGSTTESFPEPIDVDVGRVGTSGRNVRLLIPIPACRVSEGIPPRIELVQLAQNVAGVSRQCLGTERSKVDIDAVGQGLEAVAGPLGELSVDGRSCQGRVHITIPATTPRGVTNRLL